MGGDGAQNAALAMEVLSGGGRKTIKEAVCLNSAAILYLSGKTGTLKEGYEAARAAIESGKTLEKLKQIQAASC